MQVNQNDTPSLEDFATHLATLVSYPTESQDPAKHPVLRAYLEKALVPPLFKDMGGFTTAIHDNPKSGGGPILLATRIEDQSLPTVLTYGHGDVVPPGMQGAWADGRDPPYQLDDAGDRFFGRGTADNKGGQHLINLLALKSVLDAQQGRLGYNVKFLIETSEEVGSIGLREFATAHPPDLLSADVLIASDGPRVAPPDVPTLCLGHRGGVMNFTLEISLREEAHHSGTWGGGFIADPPAVILSHAIAAISTREGGRLNVPEWRPESLDPAMRRALDGCPFDAGTGPDRPPDPPDWGGEPGLTQWEKTALWPSFAVLAIDHGDAANPVNAVQPCTKAHCGIRFPPASIDQHDILPALRRYLDAHGFTQLQITQDPPGNEDFPPATCLSPPDTPPWVAWAVGSVQRCLGKKLQVLPSSGGSLPNDIFTKVLGLETLWLPHSYNSCCQHAPPDEHLLKSTAREGGLAMMTALWRDLSVKAGGQE